MAEYVVVLRPLRFTVSKHHLPFRQRQLPHQRRPQFRVAHLLLQQPHDPLPLRHPRHPRRPLHPRHTTQGGALLRQPTFAPLSEAALVNYTSMTIEICANFCLVQQG
jgi:hypothetical protein